MESLHYLLMKTHAHINRLILSQAAAIGSRQDSLKFWSACC